MLLRTRNTLRKSFSRKDPAFSHANVPNEDIKRDNYTCYRCQHFLEIPRNLSRPFGNRISTFVDKRCKVELSFIQAIVWLKSAITCASQISVEQLEQIFDKQWNTRGRCHCEDECTDVERLRSPVAKDLPVSERTCMKNTLAMSTPLDISDIPCFTPQRTILYARSEDIQSKLLSSMSTNDLNQSSVEFLILESSNSCHSNSIVTKEKKRETEFSIIPETDVESILSEDLNVYNSIPEHQCFESDKDIECSAQNTLKNGIQQINKKIIENRHILQKNHNEITSKFILSAKNQSINPVYDLENNFNEECFTSMKSQNNLADKMLKSNSSPKSFIITPKNVSQISNINNDEYFKFLFDDNSPWQMSNNATEDLHEDSAYSTSRNDIFNYDIVETEPIAGKRLLDTEHYYKLQPYKEKIIMHETGKVSSSINGMTNGSPKSLILTQKEVSQISDVYNNENSEFQIVSDEQTSDIIFENSEDDAGAYGGAKSIGDKCTLNIEHCELNPYNEETITCEKMTSSASIIRGAVMPSTNIKHRYNLRACNNREINGDKKVSSTIIRRSERHKSKQARNLLQNENENEDKMISADWLNFTLESLRIECLIIKSIEVILSTLCDKKTVEEYMIKERRRNMRNYWKDSLEEEAINTVLNISDIFITEKKPNICIKIIMTALSKTLNEITMRPQLNKIYYMEVYIIYNYFYIYKYYIE